MEGWVSKKRPTGLGKFKMWQRRYLVVNSEYLSYFGENERKTPKAQFRLNEIESATLVGADKKPDHTRFDIVCRPVVIGMVKGASEEDTMKRVYWFRASSPEDAKKWVSIINTLTFGETIDLNGALLALLKPDVSLAIARGEITTAPSNGPDSAVQPTGHVATHTLSMSSRPVSISPLPSPSHTPSSSATMFTPSCSSSSSSAGPPSKKAGKRNIGEYIMIKRIGGSFATVWLCRHQTTNKLVAIKSIKRDKICKSKKLETNLFNEINIMQKLRHDNLVNLVGNMSTERHIYLIFEYCPGGDLSLLIRNSGGTLTEAVARNLLRQLALGLRFMKGHCMVHRDLKPQNLLLSSPSGDALLKIADFGFARSLQDLTATLCGCPLYMAPEILKYQKYDVKADLWSVGAILFEMVIGHTPFTGANHVQLIQRIESTELRIPSNNLSPPCLHLIKSLLKRNPVERLGWEEFFTHPFFGGPLEGPAPSLLELPLEERLKEAISRVRSHQHSLEGEPSSSPSQPSSLPKFLQLPETSFLELPPLISEKYSLDDSDNERTGFCSDSHGSHATDYSSTYKTELCQSFETTGYCRYGLKCRFAHGQSDILPAERKNDKTKCCKTYAKSGFCPYGARCRFVHEESERGSRTASPASHALSPAHSLSLSGQVQSYSEAIQKLQLLQQQQQDLAAQLERARLQNMAAIERERESERENLERNAVSYWIQSNEYCLALGCWQTKPCLLHSQTSRVSEDGTNEDRRKGRSRGRSYSQSQERSISQERSLTWNAEDFSRGRSLSRPRRSSLSLQPDSDDSGHFSRHVRSKSDLVGDRSRAGDPPKPVSPFASLARFFSRSGDLEVKTPSETTTASPCCVKIFLVGGASSGKSSALRCLLGEPFDGSLGPSDWTDVQCKVLKMYGAEIELQIWDPETCSVSANLNHADLKETSSFMAIMFFYDTTNRQAFMDLQTWIRDKICLTGVKYMFVGTKSDLCTRRQVSIDEGVQLSREHKVSFIEVSARTGTNVEASFARLAFDVLGPRFFPRPSSLLHQTKCDGCGRSFFLSHVVCPRCGRSPCKDCRVDGGPACVGCFPFPQVPKYEYIFSESIYNLGIRTLSIDFSISIERWSRGSTAYIHRATPKDGGRELIIKHLVAPGPHRTARVGSELSLLREAEILRECGAHSQTGHPNILEFVKVVDSSVLAIVTPFYAKGTLRQILQQSCHELQSPLLRLQVARQIAKAMEFLHCKGTLHLDLKTESVLVDSFDSQTTQKQANIRLFDFGGSLELTSEHGCILSQPVGTPFFIAPEVLKCKPFSRAADVYSFGILLAELFSANPQPSSTLWGDLWVRPDAAFGAYPELAPTGGWRSLVDQVCREVDPLRPFCYVTSRIPELGKLMQDCWQANVHERPSFQHVVVRLDFIISACERLGWSEVEACVQEPCGSISILDETHIPQLIEMLGTIFGYLDEPSRKDQRQSLCMLVTEQVPSFLSSKACVCRFYKHLMLWLRQQGQDRSPEEIQWQSQEYWLGASEFIQLRCSEEAISYSDGKEHWLSPKHLQHQLQFLNQVVEWVEKDADPYLLEKSSMYAAGILVQKASEVAIQFFHCMKEVCGQGLPSQDIKIDVKKDQQRIADKIDEYRTSKGDVKGFKYVKDAMRVSFRFSCVAALIIVFRNLIAPHPRFSVLEVKCKLMTPLRNLTIVVAFTGVNGESMMGEVQLFCSRLRVPELVRFKEHIKYELERMWGENVQPENINPLGKLSKFQSIILKMYVFDCEDTRVGPTFQFFIADLPSIVPSTRVKQGSSKRVFNSVWDSRPVAIAQLIEGVDSSRFFRELALLANINHPHVVKVYGMGIDPPRLVLEQMKCTLLEYISEHGQITSLPKVLDFMKQIASGLAYLHSQGIVHRDLKPSNILLSPTDELKIADLGSSKKIDTFNDKPSDFSRSAIWAAPEILANAPYSHSADVFSCGLVFCFILTGKHPLHGMNEDAASGAICKLRLYRAQLSSEMRVFVELINNCWRQDRLLRPSMAAVLRDLTVISQMEGTKV